MGYDFALGLIVTLFVFVGIFLVCREIMCWYWKQNKIVELLEEIKEKLK